MRAILILFSYVASKVGVKKEAVISIVLGELIPFLHMHLMTLNYYNAAISGKLGIEEMTTFLQYFTYTIAENIIEDALANIGAAFMTLILTIFEKLKASESI